MSCPQGIWLNWAGIHDFSESSLSYAIHSAKVKNFDPKQFHIFWNLEFTIDKISYISKGFFCCVFAVLFFFSTWFTASRAFR